MTAPAPWHLYVLRTRDGALYTGVAIDVERRLDEHAGDGPRGAKALRGRGPLRVVYRVEVGARTLAQRAEVSMKRLAKADKERLVAAAPDRAALLAALGIAETP